MTQDLPQTRIRKKKLPTLDTTNHYDEKDLPPPDEIWVEEEDT